MSVVGRGGLISRMARGVPPVPYVPPEPAAWQQMSVAEHERTAPVFGDPAATDAGSPISGTLIPYRTWGSPILDRATGDVYLFGSMHGDYTGNDVDVLNLAEVSGTVVGHDPPPDRVRVPNAEDPAYGAGGPSEQVWYEGKGTGTFPAQGVPESTWWQSYSMHAWERTQYHPVHGMLAIGSGVAAWPEGEPPTVQTNRVLGWQKTGAVAGSGVQRWHNLAALPDEIVSGGAHGGGLSDYTGSATLMFAVPSSADRTRVFALDDDAQWTELLNLSGLPYASPPGKGGSAHIYLGGGRLLNIAEGVNGGSIFRTSVFDAGEATFSAARASDESGGAAFPAAWSAGRAVDPANLFACADVGSQLIYWGQVVQIESVWRLRLWRAPAADPYDLTALDDYTGGITLANGNNAIAAAYGRRPLHFYSGALWFFAHSGTNAPSNRPVGSYQIWRLEIGP